MDSAIPGKSNRATASDAVYAGSSEVWDPGVCWGGVSDNSLWRSTVEQRIGSHPVAVDGFGCALDLETYKRPKIVKS